MQRNTYTDVLFDGKETKDFDNPKFVLNPPIDNVVGYAVNWVNVPSTYYVIDGTNNLLVLWMDVQRNVSRVTAGSVFLNDGSGATAGFSSVGRPFYRIGPFNIILKPGTYNADTFNFELKRAMQENAGVSVTQNVTLQPNGVLYTGVTAGVLLDSADKFEFYVEPDTARAVIVNSKVLPTPNSPTEDLYNAFYIDWDNSTCKDVLGFGSLSGVTAAENGVKILTSTQQVLWTAGVKRNSARANYAIRSAECVKFVGGTTLNLHSDLPVATRYRNENVNDNIIFRFPVTGNYTTLSTYYGTPEMNPCTRQSVGRVEFYMTNGSKRLYGKHSGGSAVQNAYTLTQYLPFNGESIAVSIRFYVDDGNVYIQ